jgi:homocysteine S-methyltransferase
VNPLEAIATARGFAILDGGLATQLERQGCDLDDPLWSARVLLEAPDQVVRAHEAFFRAGADCATTATYQASFPGFAARGIDERAAEHIMIRAVELARAAWERVSAQHDVSDRPRPFIAGSIGSYGAFLADGSEYRGDFQVSHEQLIQFHRPRAAILAAHADLLACETIPCVAEAAALAVVLAPLDVPAWISFSCRDRDHLASGEPLAKAIECVVELPSIAAVGINCMAPRLACGLMDTIAKVTDKPVLVYPNANERYERGLWVGKPVTPAAFAREAALWAKKGAIAVGGCCRITPAHIERLARTRSGLH